MKPLCRQWSLGPIGPQQTRVPAFKIFLVMPSQGADAASCRQHGVHHYANDRPCYFHFLRSCTHLMLPNRFWRSHCWRLYDRRVFSSLWSLSPPSLRFLYSHWSPPQSESHLTISCERRVSCCSWAELGKHTDVDNDATPPKRKLRSFVLFMIYCTDAHTPKDQKVTVQIFRCWIMHIDEQWPRCYGNMIFMKDMRDEEPRKSLWCRQM